MLNTNHKFRRENIVNEITHRRNRIVNVYRQDYELTGKILDSLGIRHITSENEGETLCAQLCCLGMVDAVLSDDTDVLAYGTPKTLVWFRGDKETVCEISFQELTETLGMSRSEFTDFCIMCGTDYNKNIRMIGPDRAYAILKTAKTIENIPTEFPKLDISVLNHERIRELFSVPDSIDIDLSPPVKGSIQSFRQCLEDNGVNVPELIMNSIKIK